MLSGYIDYGEVDGVLDPLSAGDPFSAIREHGTGRAIRCTFPEAWRGRVRAALDPLAIRRRVVVEGMVSYRRDGTPVAIEVKDVFIRPPETRPLGDLAGSLPNFTGGVPARDYVRRSGGRDV